MNIINSIIIGVALISVLIVIVVVTRSLKSVDREIVRNIQDGYSGEKNFLAKIKQSIIYFIEWFVGKSKKVVQSIHFWAIREKKKSKNEAIKARDEFVINEDDNTEPKKIIAKRTKSKNKKNKQINKALSEGDMLKKISSQNEDAIMDSAVKGGTNGRGSDKSSFIKGLFKRKPAKKKDVDIIKNEEGSFNEWSLGDITPKSKNDVIDSMEDESKVFNETEEAVLGVDRKILEKKILQRIDKDPTNVNNYHELGELYIKMKKYDDAMEVFGYILEVSPDDLEAKRRQGKIKLLSQPSSSQSRQPRRR